MMENSCHEGTLIHGSVTASGDLNVQIVLHTYGSIEQLLSRFDVDCCACAFDMERFWMTPRCKRALEFKANVVDHSFSTSVCSVVNGNANRSSDPLGRDRKIFRLESVCFG